MRNGIVRSMALSAIGVLTLSASLIGATGPAHAAQRNADDPSPGTQTITATMYLGHAIKGHGIVPDESTGAPLSCGSISLTVAPVSGGFNYQVRAVSTMGSWMTAGYSGGPVSGSGTPFFIGTTYSDSKFISAGTRNTNAGLNITFSGSVGNVFNQTACGPTPLALTFRV